jgi:hypothetical protein
MKSTASRPTPEQIETRDRVRDAFQESGLHDEAVKIGWDEVHIPTATALRLIELYVAAKNALE